MLVKPYVTFGYTIFKHVAPLKKKNYKLNKIVTIFNDCMLKFIHIINHNS